jgi:Gas vesicle protein
MNWAGGRELYASPSIEPSRAGQVSLLDLLDRLHAGGVVTHGEITLAVADIDLLEFKLEVLVSTVRAATQT